MHLNGKGYKATLEGENKDDATSGEADVRAGRGRRRDAACVGRNGRVVRRWYRVGREALKFHVK